MMTSSKTTLAFLIYGLLVQCNVCSPLSYPNIRYGNLSPVSTLGNDSDSADLPADTTLANNTMNVFKRFIDCPITKHVNRCLFVDRI